MLSIQENISLKNYNTFHIDVNARFFVEVKSIEDIQELWASGLCDQHPFFFLGSGANVLFTENYSGVIIKISLSEKSIICEDSEYAYVKAGAGEGRHQLVMRCVDQNLGGLEHLAFIPGTVGASAVGNIGAYGTEVKDVIDEVEYIDLADKQIKTIKNADCKFAYRESIFKHELKGRILITAVIFKLKKVTDTTLLTKAVADIIALRTAKLPDPAQVGTAGSFFKNPMVTEKEYLAIKEKYPNLIGNPIQESVPSTEGQVPSNEISRNSKLVTRNCVKLSGGQLIELSGLKGYVQGNVGVSHTHALVLINLGNGTGEEMIELANHILSEVKKNFGVTLEPEVIIM